jgi:hypothetical protein
MTKPIIHSNGTSADELIKGYCEIRSRLTAAIEALQEFGPNARDYYPLGPSAFSRAVAENATRVNRLTEVCDEIETLINHCAGIEE